VQLDEIAEKTSVFVSRRSDILFGLFFIALLLRYYYFVSALETPMWDGAVYLENARDWLTGARLFEPYRPPLLSWLISLVWSLGGEGWEAVKFLSPAFTLGAGALLYITLKRHKGGLFALGVVSLTMLNAQVFFYSTQIYAEGLSLFFLVATLFFLKEGRPNHWFLAGITIGLTFASRYPIVLQAVTLFLVESLIRKDWRLVLRTVGGALAVMVPVVLAVVAKTGEFQMALPKDTSFTPFLSGFYLLNSLNIWGLAVILVPFAFIFRRTYADRYSYSFIMWFAMSLLFWSANSDNQQFRFVIQFTPAVFYLALLSVENLVKTSFLDLRVVSRYIHRPNEIEPGQVPEGSLSN
jgi:hypothetical protein